jgi:hypothetical protein
MPRVAVCFGFSRREPGVSKPNPIQMQKFLAGVDYPADRDTLIEHARSQGADDDVLQGLSQLPDRSFDGPNAVSAEYSKN